MSAARIVVMFQNYRSLILDGKQFKSPELKLLCEQKLSALANENWEFMLFAFIAEWLNDSSTVHVRTSGTTGPPKKISVSKDRMLKSARLTIRQLQLQPGSAALLCLSCEHIAGKMMAVRAFAGGLNLLTVEPSSNPLKSIPTGQSIGFAAFVPMQVQEIMDNKKTAKKFEKIKSVLIGGSPISDALKSHMKKMRNTVYETFGMTETISHIALKKLSDGNEHFTALDGITVTADLRGCLVINAPDISGKPIVTNDIVALKDERNFTWLGRFDNVINSGGIKLIPELLEEKIKGVVTGRYFFKGMPDKKLGEKLILFIEGNEFRLNDLRHLKKELRRILGKYETPKDIIFLPEFKITSSGKIKR